MSKKNDDLFVPIGHFYSPIPDPEDVEAHLARQDKDKQILGIDFHDDEMRSLWNELLPAMKKIPFTDKPSDTLRYYYLNDQFSFGDASIFYSMLATRTPKRMIEIGSGYSSALALDVNQRENLGIDFTFIEPYPDRLNMLLKSTDRRKAKIVEKKVQEVELELFDELEEGDLLFIDSSHVVKTGSDVCYELLEILPRLKAGVTVAIHDMFYPFEYPKSWCLDDNRGWTELYLVRAMLMHSQRYKIKFFNHYFGLKHIDLASDPSTPFHKNFGGTLWLDICDQK
jgi:predicted O-methyltransferase YrrM